MDVLSDMFWDLIGTEVLQTRGFNCWLSRRYIINDLLDKLQPSIPEDSSTGRIAFDVPDKNRMKIKTGRFLTRKLNLNSGFLSDKSIAVIAENINSELFSDDIAIELIRGQDITRAYKNGVGVVSCMCDGGPGGGSGCTLLYENNPDRFQMLTIFYQEDSARAIVHKLDNGRFFMDRVYSSCNMLAEKMQSYAEGADWDYRISTKAGCRDVTCENSTLSVSGLSYEDGQVPYMDTMENGCICGSGLSISAYGCQDYELLSTDGSLGRGYVCENCGDHTSEDEAICAGDCCYCESCANELFSWCGNCDELVSRDDMVSIVDVDIYVCSNCTDNYQKCEDCGEYNKENYQVIGDCCYCESCGEKYPMCAECGEQSTDNLFVDENGLCEDCQPESKPLPVFVPSEFAGQGELDL